jgi:hypothetical protein
LEDAHALRCAQVLPPVSGYKKKPLEEAIHKLDELAKH